MAMRPIRSGGVAGTPSRRRPVGLVYEDFKPLSEWRSENEADILLVHLPGFMKEMIKVTTENRNIVRIRGERVLMGNKWSRFQEDYQVPEYCDMRGIRAKFEGGILAITMPRKIVANVVAPRGDPTPRIRTNQDQETRNNVDNSGSKLVPSPRAYVEKQGETQKGPNIRDVDAGKRKERSMDIDQKGPPTKKADAEKETQESLNLNDQKGSLKKAASDDHRDMIPRVFVDAEKRKEKSSDNDHKGPLKKADAEKDKEKEKSSTLNDQTGPSKKTSSDDRDMIPRVFAGAEKQLQDHVRREVSEGRGLTRGKEPILEGGKPKDIRNVTLSSPSFKVVDDYKKMVVKGLGIGKNEDKELLVNMGAAVLVLVALGTYVSYTTFKSLSSE